MKNIVIVNIFCCIVGLGMSYTPPPPDPREEMCVKEIRCIRQSVDRVVETFLRPINHSKPNCERSISMDVSGLGLEYYTSMKLTVTGVFPYAIQMGKYAYEDCDYVFVFSTEAKKRTAGYQGQSLKEQLDELIAKLMEIFIKGC